MKRILMLGLASSFLLGLSVFSQPAPAGAGSAATEIVGSCVFLSKDCLTVDKIAVVTSASISVNSAGGWTASCSGTTTNKPTKATKCDGEALNNVPGTESAPNNFCLLENVNAVIPSVNK